MDLDIEKHFRQWWAGLDPYDVRAINDLGAGEAWYQFDFGRFCLRCVRDLGCNTSVKAEKRGRVDITINDIGIEFKILWNNKNLWTAADSVVADIQKLRERHASGYVALLWAFYNRHSEANELSSSFVWKKGLLQPEKPGDDFPPIAGSLHGKILNHISTQAKMEGTPPSPQFKVGAHDTWNYEVWFAATFWKVS